MSDRIFEDRRTALEEAFFAKQNAELLQKLRESEQKSTSRGALSLASGITDEAVLDEVLALGVSAETWAAFSIAPLVLVAWADGDIQLQERAAVLAGAEKAGIMPGDTAHALLDQWLAEAPGPALLNAWKAYTAALTALMTPTARGALRQSMLAQTEKVADAAGGILGLGNRISAPERAVMQDMAGAFGD